MPVAIPEETVERVRRLRRGRRSIETIARTLRIHEETVRGICAKHEIKARKSPRIGQEYALVDELRESLLGHDMRVSCARCDFMAFGPARDVLREQSAHLATCPA